MTLVEAYHLAFEHSERVSIARINVDDANVRWSGTWNELEPTITGTTSATAQRERIVNMNVFAPAELFAVGGRIQQPVFRKGFFASREAGERGYDAAVASLARERQRLARDVARVFIDVVRARRLLEIAHDSVQRADQQLKFASARVKAGAVLKNAELLATIDLRRANRQLAIAERDVGLAEAAFQRLIGKSPPDLVLPPPPALPSRDQALEIVKQRKDVVALQLQLSKARAEESAARDRRWWPRLDAQASIQYTQPKLFGSNIDWQVVGLVTFPLFQAGRELTDVSLQENRTHLASLVLQEQLEIVTEEVDDAALQLTSANAVFEHADKQATAAKDNYKLVDTQFRLGGVTFLEVTNAQAVLVEADNALAVATMDQTRAVYDFLYAIGTLDLEH
jgi:outer membrane protein